MICAIDVETSGLNPGYHQIMELAIIPVGENWGGKLDDALHLRLRVSKFDKEALKINGLRPLEGLTREEGHKAFYEWKIKNGIPKIVALGHNVVFDLSFMSNWLPSNDNSLHYIHYDSMQLALAINAKKKVFQGVSLKKIAETLEIKNEMPHSSLSDAITALNCYKAMIDKFIMV